MTLTEDGKVGVGTTNPQRTLHVHGDILINGHEGSIYFGNEYQEQYLDNGEWAIEFAPLYEGNQSGLNFWKPSGSHNLSGEADGFGNYYLFISDDGNVGIGTGRPDYKLDVCGTIRSTEWIVQAQWWDCKLNPDYKRMSWQEKSEYIIKNGHLPEIDSGKDIETNGLQVGKTMSGFISNIEDNTLDIIDLYKENQKLKEQIDEFKKENNLLEKKYEILENKLEKIEKSK
jgi:hypothetical protein